MNRKLRNRLAFWLGVGAALPFAYASSYAVNGAPPAEGCSGSGAEESPAVLSVSGAPYETNVGRDAFFAFEAITRGLEPEDARSAIAITVTDEDEQPVAGQLVILKQTEDAGGTTTLLLGWTASGAARTVGEVLALNAQAPSSLGGTGLEARLTIVDLAPELQLPSFEFFDFEATLRDRGTAEACEGINDCGATWYGTELNEEVEVLFIAGGIDPGVLVAWDFHFEELPGKGAFAEPAAAFPIAVPDIHESVRFSGKLDEYCVRLVGRDLKNDTTESSEICASPAGMLHTTLRDRLGECLDPPAGLEKRWCAAVEDGPSEWRHIGDDEEELCARLLAGPSGAGGESAMPGAGGAGSDEPTRGGSGGSAGDPGASDPPPKGNGGQSDVEPDAGAPPDPGAGAAHGDDSKTTAVITESGCGCRTASDPTGQNGVLACTGLLALAAGIGLRRRRER